VNNRAHARARPRPRGETITDRRGRRIPLLCRDLAEVRHAPSQLAHLVLSSTLSSACQASAFSGPPSFRGRFISICTSPFENCSKS